MTGSTLAAATLWGYGLAAAGFFVFAARLALGRRRNARGAMLIAAIIATTLWAAAGASIGISSVPWVWLGFDALDALRYITWFAFLASLLAGKSWGEPASSAGSLLPGWGIALIVTALAASVALWDGFPFAPAIDAHVRTLEFGLRLGLAVFGLILIEQLLRRAPLKARWSIKHLCMGLAGVFAFDLLLYADALLYARLDPDIWVARGVANLLVIPFVAISTARNIGWTIEMHMSRSVVFHSAALLLSGAILLAIAAAAYYVRSFGGEWGRALQIEVVFAALVLSVLVLTSGRFRSRLRVFVSKHFFSYRYDYRREWLRFTDTLATSPSAPSLQQRAIKALADLVESPGGSLWLMEEGGTFRLVARASMAGVDVTEPRECSLVQFLERTGWIVTLPEYAAEPGNYPNLSLPKWLSEMPEAWLVVPLPGDSGLFGFVVLAAARAPLSVDWEVRDILKAAARATAGYLSQLQLAEALLEARKFDAFNRMSAFVIHDLKNLVAQLSLMVKNAERHRDNPQFQRDMLVTVENVVGRMNGLMLQLQLGTTPIERARPIDLSAMIERVCASKSATIVLDPKPGVLALGHEERLEHVTGHIIQNALDATAAKGEVRVRIEREAGFAVVIVDDTGVGMSAAYLRERLFKAFETTKSSGTGIGMYESNQYIAQLGGRMIVESEEGLGTSVRVLLPLADATASASVAKGVMA